MGIISAERINRSWARNGFVVGETSVKTADGEVIGIVDRDQKFHIIKAGVSVERPTSRYSSIDTSSRIVDLTRPGRYEIKLADGRTVRPIFSTRQTRIKTPLGNFFAPFGL